MYVKWCFDARISKIKLYLLFFMIFLWPLLFCAVLSRKKNNYCPLTQKNAKRTDCLVYLLHFFVHSVLVLVHWSTFFQVSIKKTFNLILIFYNHYSVHRYLLGSILALQYLYFHRWCSIKQHIDKNITEHFNFFEVLT